MKKAQKTFYLILSLILILGILIILPQFPNYFSTVSSSNLSYKEELPVEEETVNLTPSPTPKNYMVKQDSIYSFSQGPKAWKKKHKWSGSWGNLIIDGNAFGNFGCGFCCMANIYSTLTDYECSPVDMYSYAKKVSSYMPQPGIGAIGWQPMEHTLETCGFSSTLHQKDAKYENFQMNIQNSYATIVLICSQNDNSYWQNTPGHYVTIWRYNSENDTVFLTDPGDPDHNRNTINLSLVYNALKTASSYQYLTIDAYNEEDNLWKWNQVSEKWIRP